VRSTTDNRGYQGSARVSYATARRSQHFCEIADFPWQVTEARFICWWKCPYYEIYCSKCRQNIQPNELAQPSSQFVSLHDCMTMLSHNYRSPCMRKQGVVGPNFQMFGTQSSPCFLHLLQIWFPREPRAPRIAKLPRRRRTCWAAELSAAFFPSFDGGSEPRGPTELTFSPETRVSEYDAYFGDGRLAYPLMLQIPIEISNANSL